MSAERGDPEIELYAVAIVVCCVGAFVVLFVIILT